ncbi:MAG TPA: hypothetical protein VFW34_09445 [Candidatus Rubrimentiphilum sp.]|nr:hypothetical protein [Candidatus Rubrimentiphilum sp.]
MFSRRHWVPPGALIFAQISHGASWFLLLWAGLTGSISAIGFPAIAWIHTVALGSGTTAAAGVLLHVIPRFSDVRWKAEGLARYSLFFFCVGVVFFVSALLLRPNLAVFGAGVIVLALLAYAAAATATLAQAFRGEPVERAVARALLVTLLLLLVTALLGFALSAWISGYASAAWIAALPAAHGNLGMLGWLSLLIFGVSVRTVRPITGARSRFPAAHIIVGSFTVIGVALLAVGLGGASALMWPGAVLFGFAALVYALDLLDVLRRAIGPFTAPRAFLLAAVFWLLCALALGGGTLAGRPWQLAYGFVLMAGWLVQMINAHIYHIGVRVMLTAYRGEDDETRPQTVLDARLSWLSFAAFQLAIASAAIGLLAQNANAVSTGGALGAIGWLAMMANLAVARSRAMQAPRNISLL